MKIYDLSRYNGNISGINVVNQDKIEITEIIKKYIKSITNRLFKY